jgi:hypothetical protein
METIKPALPYIPRPRPSRLPSIRFYTACGAYLGNKKQKTGKKQTYMGKKRGIYWFLFGKRRALGALEHLRQTPAEEGVLRAGEKRAKLVHFMNNLRN